MMVQPPKDLLDRAPHWTMVVACTISIPPPPQCSAVQYNSLSQSLSLYSNKLAMLCIYKVVKPAQPASSTY